MTQTTDHSIEERKEFIQIRQHYIDSAHRSSNIFDSTMITLTTAALGGSMFLIKNHSKEILHKERLLITRGLLGLTLLLILVSFILSEEANRLSIDQYDEEYQDGSCEKIAVLKYKVNIKNQCIEILKWASIFTLILGVVGLVLFLYTNI